MVAQECPPSPVAERLDREVETFKRWEKATSVIPIVFATAGDPVGSGLMSFSGFDPTRTLTGQICRAAQRGFPGAVW